MATNNSNEQIRNISIQDRQAQNTAADWARQLRFSNDVNMSTVGVDTDRVTPDLLMATSKKLLGILLQKAAINKKKLSKIKIKSIDLLLYIC